MPLYDPSQRLVVGARFACLRCRKRSLEATCPTCGRAALDLRTPEAVARVTRMTTRGKRAHDEPGRSQRERTYTLVTHCVAALCALAAGYLGSRMHTGGYVSVGFVVALAAGLGFVAGYILCAMAAVLVLLVATVVAVAGAVAVLVIGLPMLLPLLFLRDRARRASDLVGAAIGFGVKAFFAPVAVLRGMPVSFATMNEDRTRGLLSPSQLAKLPDVSADETPRVEGTITDESGTVSLGSDLSGAIVGVSGCTMGAGVRDALVAPLMVRTDEGETLGVRLESGEVRVRGAGRAALLGQALPSEWGVPRRSTLPRKRRSFPSAQQVDAWVVPAGARVRVEGGAVVDEAVASPTESYRSTRFVRTIVGTADSPVVLTVLDATG